MEMATSAAGGEVEPTRVRPGMVIFLGALTALGPLSMDMYLPATPTIGRVFDATTASVQLTLTSFLVGLGVGQLVTGPLSDRIGRRRPLLIGLIAYVVLSAACAAAPTVPLLIAARGLQGVAAATGVVLSLATVRDLYGDNGARASRAFAEVAMVTILAPVVAPVVGAQLLRVVSWRGVFVVLAVIGLLIFVVALRVMPERLPSGRSPEAATSFARRTRSLWTDPTFAIPALVFGFGFGALFCYISSSSFVVEDHYGRSAQFFSLLFAANAVGLLLANRLANIAVKRIAPRKAVLYALAFQLTACSALLVACLIGDPDILVFSIGLFLAVAPTAMVGPLATSLALERQHDRAGMAASQLGTQQIVIGACIAPLAGLGGPTSPTTMVLVMFCAILVAAVLSYVGIRRQPNTFSGPVKVSGIATDGTAVMMEAPPGVVRP